MLLIALWIAVLMAGTVLLLIVFRFVDAPSQAAQEAVEPGRVEEPSEGLGIEETRWVGLEAQFLVAPGLALCEAQSLLLALAPEAKSETPVAASSLSAAERRARFEGIIAELDRRQAGGACYHFGDRRRSVESRGRD